MDEHDIANLDLEFKRYLQLLRPYLVHLVDEKVVKLCDAWIKRLSDSKDEEKVLRNKYIFLLCYQLARGTFSSPFLSTPPPKLHPLADDVNSDDSSTEIEEVVVNVETPNIKILYDSNKISVSESDYLSQDSDRICNESEKTGLKNKPQSYCRPTIICYQNLESKISDYKIQEDDYELRASNLVKKLREIKIQNILLNKELTTLKEGTKYIQDDFTDHITTKVDNATSPVVRSNESSATLKSLRHQLQETQDSRNVLIETISNLQNQLDNFNEVKKNQINDIEAKHKLHLIKVRTEAREETKLFYETKLEELKQSYDITIKQIQDTADNEIKSLTKAKEEIIEDKDKLLESKDKRITGLLSQIETQKTTVQSMMAQFIEKSSEDVSCEGLRLKNHLLEKRLNKIEKSKFKCSKIYEAKLLQLQRDKHLAECSLQLQLVRQRAQVVSEMSDENQTELNTSLDKLEVKYKEIIANVQATAIQRRIQDQKALECLLKAACGLDDQNQYPTPLRNHNQSYESENTSFARNTRANNAVMGNKSFGEDSILPGYCLNGDKMGELFERLHIPQRDNSNPEPK